MTKRVKGKAVLAWAVTINGEIIRDTNNCYDIYVTSRDAEDCVARNGGIGNEWVIIPVEIRLPNANSKKK